jgi:rRNA-processing protein FCF1
MSKTDYKDNRSKLAEKIKNAPSKLQIQEVRPIEEKKSKEAETHVNFWTSSTVMDEIKILSIKNKKTIKQLATEAFTDLIEKYKS